MARPAALIVIVIAVVAVILLLIRWVRNLMKGKRNGGEQSE